MYIGAFWTVAMNVLCFVQPYYTFDKLEVEQQNSTFPPQLHNSEELL